MIAQKDTVHWVRYALLQAWIVASFGCGSTEATHETTTPDSGTETPTDMPDAEASTEASTDAAAADGADVISPQAAAIGRACQSDADCSGLHCIRPSDDFGPPGSGGPAHGYCSLDCTAETHVVNKPPTDVCAALNSYCINFGTPSMPSNAWCLRFCSMGAGAKCLQRTDMACAAEGLTNTHTLCIPMCASDADCGGRKCDEETGLCVDTPAQRDPTYSACVFNGPTQTCTEACVSFSQDAQKGKLTPGICSRMCVIGAASACGRDLASPLSSGLVGTCIGPRGTGAGDLGRCFQLCDSAADCRDKDPGVVCDPSSIPVFGHGLCTPPNSFVDAGALPVEGGPGDAQVPEATIAIDTGLPEADASPE
jgi:hypothetical protein